MRILDDGTGNLVTVIWTILKLRMILLVKGEYQEVNTWHRGERLYIRGKGMKFTYLYILLVEATFINYRKSRSLKGGNFHLLKMGISTFVRSIPVRKIFGDLKTKKPSCMMLECQREIDSHIYREDSIQ